MEEYDEDVNENPWYLAFVHNQSKLFLEITSERWIICVPKYGSWKGDNNAPKAIGSSNFQSHCIKYEGEDIFTSKSEDGAQIRRKIDRYVTHNGKVLMVEGSKLMCGPGFEESATSFDSKSGLLDLPSSGLNHSAKILFEETYFNANDQSYKMLCISRPLEVHLAKESNFGQTQEDHTSNAESVSGGLGKRSSDRIWKLASKPNKLKRIVDSKIADYIKYHGKITTTQSTEGGMGGETVEMDEITGVDACEASVNSLYNLCLEIVMKDWKIKKEMETNPLDTTKVALESYVLQEVYGSVSRQIASSVASQEATFNKKICNLFDVQPRDLEVDERYWVSLPRAKRHLSRINKYYTPHDKLSCVQRAISCITAKQEIPKNAALGSDDLLPIVIYLVIRSGIPNWITNLVYLERFQLVRPDKEQSSFYLATLQAAVEHIKTEHAKLPLREIKADKLDDSLVHEYFQAIHSGDIDTIKKILSISASKSKEREQKMCHPLCDCESCAKLKRSRSATRSEVLVTVHTKNEKGQTALHVAALLGRHELVDTLIEAGAKLNSTDYYGSTPLHCAAQSGSQSVVFLLLHFGANQNSKDNNNNTPLHICCQRGHEMCAKAILYFDPTALVVAVNLENDDGDTPLHIASRWGYVGIVAALIECGANPQAINRRRQSTVDVSLNDSVSSTIKVAATQVVRIVRTLKYLQSEQNKQLDYPQTEKPPARKSRPRAITPKELDNTIDCAYVAKQVEKMFRAVNDNDLNMVRFLCGWQKTENDELTKMENDTCHPLCQCPKCQPLAPEHVLHANSANQEKYTGLILAAKHGFVEMTKLFLDHGASVNTRTKKHGYSALHFACECGSTEVLRAILSTDGVNPDTRDENGSTPLYACAIHNFVDCALILLEKSHWPLLDCCDYSLEPSDARRRERETSTIYQNSSLNIRNRNGDTPLHVAVKWKNAEIISTFLEYGALVYYKNNDGLTAIDLADKDPAIKSLLLKAASQYQASSPTVEVTPLGVSPHSPYNHTPDAVSDSNIPTIALNSSTSFLNSLNDEEIADSLYSKFKDPTPPTPPIGSQTSVTSEAELLDGGEVDVFDEVENFDGTGRDELISVQPHVTKQLSSTRSASSDIFRDIGKQSESGKSVDSYSEHMAEGVQLLSDTLDRLSFSSSKADENQKIAAAVGEKEDSTTDSYFEMG